jgi:hypothetical protein
MLYQTDITYFGNNESFKKWSELKGVYKFLVRSFNIKCMFAAGIINVILPLNWF